MSKTVFKLPFGFELKRSEKNKKDEQKQISPIPPPQDDGALVLDSLYSGAFDSFLNNLGSHNDQIELINRYRQMEHHPTCDSAIDDIVNESLANSTESNLVELDFDPAADLPARVRKIIIQEFDEVLKMLKFRDMGYSLFRRWYVDGHLYFHAIVTKGKEKEGIQELRFVDPRQIQKIRDIKREKREINGHVVDIVVGAEEYYVYHSEGLSQNLQSNQFMFYDENSHIHGSYCLNTDSVIHVHSGKLAESPTIVVSHLHKAMKALNQLKMIEDATVIYRMTRAPERRIFNIDVGSIQRNKLDQYMENIMSRFRNRVVYNQDTGQIDNDRQFYSMQEDFFLARREGSQGSSIETLPGGENLGEIADVEYFQRNLYKALNVPIGRLDSQNNFNVGRVTEITRDEVKFDHFIQRLRIQFSNLFIEILERQLILKRVLSDNEWKDIKDALRFVFSKDNYFSEMKNQEVWEARLQTLSSFEPYAGKYVSHKWLRENILQQSEDVRKRQDKEIAAEQEEMKEKAEDKYEIDSLNPFITNPPTQEQDSGSEQSEEERENEYDEPSTEDSTEENEDN